VLADEGGHGFPVRRRYGRGGGVSQFQGFIPGRGEDEGGFCLEEFFFDFDLKATDYRDDDEEHPHAESDASDGDESDEGNAAAAGFEIAEANEPAVFHERGERGKRSIGLV